MATSSTTNYHFPYPLGSDSLSNVALRIQELAQSIDDSYTTLGINLSGSAALMQVGDLAGGALTGTYPNPTIDPSVPLPDGTCATTQAQSDNSTKVATTAYVDAYVAGSVPDGAIGTVELADGAVTDVKVNAAAAISYAKLNLANSLVNADISNSAAIADSKLATISTAGKVSNSATTATNANTPSAIVARDASGNFSAGTITANLSGNASTVTTNANLTGDVTSVGNTTTIAPGVIIDADINAAAAISYSKLSLAGSISNTDFRNSAGLSVVGRSASTTGSVADITAGTDGHVLRRSGTTIGFGTIVNAATTATNLNTASAIVARDASGNFSAGTITAALTGTASLATALAGGSANAIPYQTGAGATSFITGGSVSNVLTLGVGGVPTWAAAGTPGAHASTHALAGTDPVTLDKTQITGTAITAGDTGTVTNNMLAGSIADTKLSTISTAGKVSNSATTATNANTASAIVARDASGNFTAGTITAALSGNATSATNIAGGATNGIPYQTGSGTTGFIASGYTALKNVQQTSSILTTGFSTTSTTPVDIGLSVTITPSTTSSKILIFATLGNIGVDGAGYLGYYYLTNGAGTMLFGGTGGTTANVTGFLRAANGSTYDMSAGASLMYLHSPASTSAQTYKIQAAISNSATILTFGKDNGGLSVRSGCNIIAMEILQ